MSDAIEIKVITPDGHDTIVPGPDEHHVALSELLRRHTIPVNTRCGQRGLCDSCLIALRAGAIERVSDGQKVSADDGLAEGESGLIRSCAFRLAGRAVTIEIPRRSLAAYKPQVVDAFRVNVPYAHDPLVEGAFAFAVDIGTTTVVAALVDLADGQIVERTSSFNHQMHMGDDVLTRINLCSTDPTMLSKLHEAVMTQTIQTLIRDAMETAKVPAEKVGGVVLSGNTTMLHLAASVDPSPMGVAPFTPVFLEHRRSSASQMGLELPGDPPVHLLPSAAAYIGADLVAGVLSSGLLYDEGPSLLVDVGTNGEIILKHGDQLLGCATAAGPAFEGSRLTSGMRAGHGAISHVKFVGGDEAVDFETIDEADPVGLCGSAYLDFLAAGRRGNLLTPTGRLIEESADGRLETVPGYGKAYRIARARGADQSIVVAETDIASLLQAKGAIGAGILTLLGRAELESTDIRKVYLAGGFGMHIDIANAIGCGLLPGFEPAQVQVVGNTSLAGAYLALIDRGALDEMVRIGQSIQTVELNLEPEFEMTYIEQLSLP